MEGPCRPQRTIVSGRRGPGVECGQLGIAVADQSCQDVGNGGAGETRKFLLRPMQVCTAAAERPTTANLFPNVTPPAGAERVDAWQPDDAQPHRVVIGHDRVAILCSTPSRISRGGVELMAPHLFGVNACSAKRAVGYRHKLTAALDADIRSL